MSQIVLVNPNQMKPAIAPLALDYLGNALKQAGWEVAVLDLCWSDDPQADIARYFAGEKALLVGFTIRNTDDTYFASQDFFIPRYRAMIEAIGASTPAPVILGGAGFSVMPEAVLAFCGAELGICGEGERALVEIAARLSNGEPVFDVPGLVYRSGRGFKRNPPKYLTLENMAAPGRDVVANPRYFSEGGQGNIETKRGCNKGCTYCADPISKGRKIRLRSPASVADEIENLLSLNVDCFHFCDAEFNLPEHHARGVCEELIRRRLGERIRWYTYASPAPFDAGLASLMRRAGCAGINFGVDSGCDDILRRLGRDFTAEDLARTAQACRRVGLVFMYDLLLAGPGETKETLRATVELMRKLRPDRVGAAVGVRVYPGTAFARWVLDQGPPDENPDLQGVVRDNESFLAPIFFVNAALGEDALSCVGELIGGDPRFFVGSREEVGQNYNYNDNSVLVNAIKAGHRGAFWDILRRIAGE